MLARIRKAVVGAAAAGLAAGVSFLAKAAVDGTVHGNDVAQALAAAIPAAIIALGAVYGVRNTGTVNGSDPEVGGSTIIR
jgi:heme/copper-type cytochrome/quinol oxidase subunit 2